MQNKYDRILVDTITTDDGSKYYRIYATNGNTTSDLGISSFTVQDKLHYYLSFITLKDNSKVLFDDLTHGLNIMKDLIQQRNKTMLRNDRTVSITTQVINI